jgi:hypothetical protein
LPWIFAQHNGLDPNADGGAGDAAETPDANGATDGQIGNGEATVAADAETVPDSSGGFPFDAGQVPDSSRDAASPSDASTVSDSSGDANPLDDATGQSPSGQSTAVASSGCTFTMQARSTPWDDVAILAVGCALIASRRAGRRVTGLAP